MPRRGNLPAPLTLRPEYTSRHNRKKGRHGWLRVAPAYSVTLAEELLAETTADATVLDPFGGTGTTALAAATRGLHAVSLDINPFMSWLTRAKCATYTSEDLSEAREVMDAIVTNSAVSRPLVCAPPVHNIERWWTPERLLFLRKTKTGIANAPCGAKARDLLLVGFCRVVGELANLTPRHQSLSFQFDGPAQESLPLEEDPFGDAMRFVLETAAVNPERTPTTSTGDARTLDIVDRGSIDVVATSPPYPNRVSLIRELRPFMYWLGYLVSPSDAGVLDWNAIGGTWGAATSRLTDWVVPHDVFVPATISSVAKRIGREDVPSATAMSTYVLRYFSDMWRHAQALRSVMAPKGRFHYVVGNSTFYGHLVETEKALVSIFGEAGFHQVTYRTIRKRTSKADLFEFVVEGVS